jgi:hypothetical protein
MKLENLPRANELARLLSEIDRQLRLLNSEPKDFLGVRFIFASDLDIADKELLEFLRETTTNYFENKRERVAKELEDL